MIHFYIFCVFIELLGGSWVFYFRPYLRLLSCGEDKAEKQMQVGSMRWMVKVKQGELWLLGLLQCLGAFY